VLWFLALVSLAGFPPSGGFVTKLMLLQAAIGEQSYGMVAVAGLVNLLSLLPLLHIWHGIFWKALPPHVAPPRRATVMQVFPGALLIGALLLFALNISSVVNYTYLSTQQAFDTQGYIEAVLNIAQDTQ
jgi:multicomponent Na+:H+ antiporter subunit D